MSNITNIAIKKAKYSNVRRGKVSAIAFSSSGQIIATAHNRRINGHQNIFTQHAESSLIDKLKKLSSEEDAIIFHIDIMTVGIDCCGLTGVMFFKNSKE